MKEENLFLGSIKICVSYDNILDLEFNDKKFFGHVVPKSISVSENVLLYKLDNNTFIDVDNINFLNKNIIEKTQEGDPFNFKKNFMMTSPYFKGQTFVDEESLISLDELDKSINSDIIKKLKMR